MDEECYTNVELSVGQMRAGVVITAEGNYNNLFDILRCKFVHL